MDSVETEFRNVEEKLDLLLASEKRALCSAGFVVEDNSSRTYHYKNSHLIWIHSFRKEWLVDIERACVSVTLSYSEPIEADSGVPYVDLSARAELFQQGRESRIEDRTKSKVSLVDLERLGILNVVTTAFAQSARCLR